MVIATERVVAPTLSARFGDVNQSHYFRSSYQVMLPLIPRPVAEDPLLGSSKRNDDPKRYRPPPTSDQPSRPEAVRLGLSVPSKDDNCIIKFRAQEKETIAVYGGNI